MRAEYSLTEPTERMLVTSSSDRGGPAIERGGTCWLPHCHPAKGFRDRSGIAQLRRSNERFVKIMFSYADDTQSDGTLPGSASGGSALSYSYGPGHAVEYLG